MTHAAPGFDPPAEPLPTPTIPEPARTVAYLTGAVSGLAVAPSLLAAGLTVPAAIAIAISGAANAIAFGYRPTR